MTEQAWLMSLQWQTTDSPASPSGRIHVLRAVFRAPDGDIYTTDIPNGGWTCDNMALQFLAKYGYKVSDWERHKTKLDVKDDNTTIPVEQSSNGWIINEKAFEDAPEALEDAEWFNEDIGAEVSQRDKRQLQQQPGDDDDDGGSPVSANGGSQ